MVKSFAINRLDVGHTRVPGFLRVMSSTIVMTTIFSKRIVAYLYKSTRIFKTTQLYKSESYIQTNAVSTLRSPSF